MHLLFLPILGSALYRRRLGRTPPGHHCCHFIDPLMVASLIRLGRQTWATPVSCGLRGLELVKILEASYKSLREHFRHTF
jgi:hypothetical protein